MKKIFFLIVVCLVWACGKKNQVAPLPENVAAIKNVMNANFGNRYNPAIMRRDFAITPQDVAEIKRMLTEKETFPPQKLKWFLGGGYMMSIDEMYGLILYQTGPVAINGIAHESSWTLEKTEKPNQRLVWAIVWVKE